MNDPNHQRIYLIMNPISQTRRKDLRTLPDLRQYATVRLIGLALFYFLTGKLSFAIFYQAKIVTLTAFLPEGLALAAVLIYGPRIIPGIFLGQLLLALDAGLHLLPSLGVSLVNSAEAALAFFVARKLRIDIRLRSVRDILLLVGMILFVLQPFSSLLGNGVLYLTQETDNAFFRSNLFYWWFGNTMGQLLLTPLLLFLRTDYRRIRIPLLLLIVIAAALLNYLLQVTLGMHSLALLMLVTLPLLIQLSTVNLSYALSGGVALALSSLVMVHYHLGIFVHEKDLSCNLINLNFCILSVLLLVLIIGTLFREKEEALAELKMAHCDPLTGLLNRNHLETQLQHSLELVTREQTISALCYIDLDHFKAINDSYGHAVGDLVLQETAYRIRHHLRPDDVLLRLGGDEFLLILNHIRRMEEMEEILQGILQTIARPIYAEGHVCSVTASIGVVLIPRKGLRLDRLLRQADMTMYQAKEKGKNCYLIAEPLPVGQEDRP